MVNGAGYPLWIDPKDEPIFREAGRMIERSLVQYRTRFRGSELSPENMLAMTAIELAANLRRKDLDADPAKTSEEISAMVADLEEFLGQGSTQS